MMLHVHLLRWHQDVGGLGLEVSDDDALAAAGTALHVHAHVALAEVDLPVHVAGTASVAGGSHLHVGGKRRRSHRRLGHSKLKEQKNGGG